MTTSSYPTASQAIARARRFDVLQLVCLAAATALLLLATSMPHRPDPEPVHRVQ